MTKGQFGLLTAALGLATMAGAGYIGFAHADSGHPSRSGSGNSGTALAGGGQGSQIIGSGGTPTGDATGVTDPDGASPAATGAASAGAGGAFGTSGTQASVPECHDGDIQVSEVTGAGGAAAGHLSVLIEFTNAAGHTCYLRGYPGASMFGPNGDVLENAVRTMTGPAGGASGVSKPQQIVLPVDGAASAIVEWSDVPVDSGSCLNPVSLGVTPPDEKQTTTLQLSGLVCSGFEVHPVVKGVSAAG